MKASKRIALYLGASSLLSVWAPPCLAALGGDAASLQKEQDAFNGSFALARGSLFSVYSLMTPTGVRIREYVSVSGLVFAVAWDGPVLPDLELLLGSSYPSYLQGLRQRSRGVHIQTSALVLESAGMMRAFVGKAFLPDAMPANLSAQDIQ